jgi:putative hydrolase of the HAD superfamily
LVSADVEAWTHLDASVLASVADLREQGYGVALLSNLPRELASAVRAILPSGLFEAMVFSSDLGFAKPDRRFFNVALRRCGIESQSAVFIDDRPVNVTAAAEIGLHAFAFMGSQRLAEQLSRWTLKRRLLHAG